MKANKRKSVVASILVASSLVLGTAPVNSARAADIKKIVSPTTDNQQLSVKYIGESDGFVFLKISFTQQNEQKSLFQINDQNGENLYKETVTVKDFSRIVKIAPEEVAGVQVSFSTNGKETSKKVVINTSVSTTYQVSEVAE